jgi:hypothetical protein
MKRSITKTQAGSELNGKKDAFRERINGLIGDSLGNNYVLGIPQSFIKYTGSLEAAAFLAQMVHWTPRAKRRDGFIFKKNAEWFDETGLKRYSLSTAAKTLEAKGVLQMQKMMAYGSPTWHYRLDMEAFERSFREFLESGISPKNKQLRKSAGGDAAIETQLESNIKTEEVAIAVREVSDIETGLRTLIQNIPPTRAEEDALDRLCGLVENGTYTGEDIAGCAKWIVEAFDMVTVTPASIEKRMMTYLAKKGSGVLDKPRYETGAQRSERINRERNSPEGKARLDEMMREISRKRVAKEIEQVEATKQFQITQGEPLRWLAEELKKREMSEDERQREREAFYDLKQCIRKGEFTETRVAKEAGLHRLRGMVISAWNLLYTFRPLPRNLW